MQYADDDSGESGCADKWREEVRIVRITSFVQYDQHRANDQVHTASQQGLDRSEQVFSPSASNDGHGNSG